MTTSRSFFKAASGVGLPVQPTKYYAHIRTGVHAVLMPFAVAILLYVLPCVTTASCALADLTRRSRRKQSARNLYLLFVILLPFILSTAYWMVEFAEQMVRINTFFVHPNERHDRNITYFATLFNAIILLNVRTSLLPYFLSSRSH